MPFRHWAERMEHPDTPTDLRCEQYYVADLSHLPESCRNGRCVFTCRSYPRHWQLLTTSRCISWIFKNMIMPLLLGWRDAKVVRTLKENMVVVRPGVCGLSPVILSILIFYTTYMVLDSPKDISVDNIWDNPSPHDVLGSHSESDSRRYSP